MNRIAFTPNSRRTRLLVTLIAVAALPAADVSGGHLECPAERLPRAEPSDPVRGRMLVLPGVYNTRFQLRGFVERAQVRLPGFEIEVRPWGTRMLPLRNLRAYERNLETADGIAGEIADWRRRHPDGRFYLVGYSGGGGVAALVVSALPDDVAIDRLILVAPAISPDYPLEREVLGHVREFVVNYASERDLQVGWGTRTFGTIDRRQSVSAGAIGFAVDDPKLVQWHWLAADAACGHRGNHVAYLDRRWQRAALLPAIDPAETAESLADRWAARHEEN